MNEFQKFQNTRHVTNQFERVAQALRLVESEIEEMENDAFVLYGYRASNMDIHYGYMEIEHLGSAVYLNLEQRRWSTNYNDDDGNTLEDLEWELFLFMSSIHASVMPTDNWMYFCEDTVDPSNNHTYTLGESDIISQIRTLSPGESVTVQDRYNNTRIK